MQDNESMKYNVASHCAQMQRMISVYTISESKLRMNSSTCLIDLRGEPSWGVKASREVTWPGRPGGDWFAVFQYWAASPWAPTERASCNWATINWARTKASLHSEKWCWLGMALGSVWEKSCDIGWRVICSVDEKLSVHQTFVGWALYILIKFVKSLIRPLGPSHRKCPTCPMIFVNTAFCAGGVMMDDRWLPCWQGNSRRVKQGYVDNVTAWSRAILTSS